MKVSRILFLAASLVAVPLPTGSAGVSEAVAATRPMAAPSPGDRVFLNDSVLDEMLGQALGEQARERRGGERFMAHAAQMDVAHTLRIGAARGLSVIYGVRPPTSLDADRRVILDRVGARSGEAYERTYARACVELHTRILERLETQARSGDDPELRREASLGVAPAMSLVRMSSALWNSLTPAAM